jgi:hypothetical protein
MGGFRGLTSTWPIARHDHPIYVHATWIAPALFAQTGTDAGYDPSFMAGYPKSVIFPQTAAYFEAIGLLTRPLGLDPARTHKLAVFLGTALPPWLILAAAATWRFSGIATLGSVVLFLLYTWTDGGGAGFPLNYAWYGMVPYLLAVPLGLLALATLSRWLGSSGVRVWFAAASLLALAWLVHLTTPMVLAPAGLAAYIVASRREASSPLGLKRHLAFWALPLVIALVNVWWWLPGVALAGTKGESGFAFAHPEPVLPRLLEIVTSAPVIQALLLGLLGPGLWILAGRDRVAAWGVFGFALAGFAWGYLAGGLRALDFLQPGRHTYAFYAAASLVGGLVFGAAANALGKLARVPAATAVAGLVLLGFRVFAGPVSETVQARLGAHGGEPFLSSRPTDRLRWILEQVRTHVRPGQRLLYEESGADLPGVPDPYQGGRYSGLLPWMTGVEVIGGPYLRAAVSTNFVQFGEGKLLGKEDWGRDEFVSACAAYGPAALFCWSPRSVAFCRAHPELVEIVAEQEETFRMVDPRTGRVALLPSRLVFAMIHGESGPVLRGTARVVARPGRIEVDSAQGDELDGLVVLRYHLLPLMRSRPAVQFQPVRVAPDPVPLIGFAPPAGAVVFELNPPP